MNDFTGWLPIRLYPGPGGDQVDWLRIGAKLPDGPFFAEDIQQLICTQAFHQLFRRQTPLQALLEWGEHTSAEPAGLIFHASRCGSTLAVRILQHTPDSAVLSEPPVLNRILQGLELDTPPRQALRLRIARALVGCWARTWPGRRLFIKLDAADSCHMSTLCALWPESPVVFMYREPVEILVSQFAQRAAFTLPGVFGYNPLGLALDDAHAMNTHEYCARVLGAVLNSGADACAAGLARAVRYQPDAGLLHEQLASAFALPARSGPSDYSSHAKFPHQHFSDDRSSKQASADTRTRALAADWMQGPVARLDSLCELHHV